MDKIGKVVEDVTEFLVNKICCRILFDMTVSITHIHTLLFTIQE